MAPAPGKLARLLPGCSAALLLVGVAGAAGPQSMEVTASAYTLRAAETKDYAPGIAAWGDKLEPGMKAIAVSRDLIDAAEAADDPVTEDLAVTILSDEEAHRTEFKGYRKEYKRD